MGMGSYANKLFFRPSTYMCKNAENIWENASSAEIHEDWQAYKCAYMYLSSQVNWSKLIKVFHPYSFRDFKLLRDETHKKLILEKLQLQKNKGCYSWK